MHRMLLIVCLLVCALPLRAQGSGQICVRAFEDRNGNALLDPNEPRITQGASATLTNVDGVIINTILLEDSTRAAEGLMCFLRLEPGQYTVTVTSADYAETTSNAYVTTITGSGIPQVFDYGAQLINVAVPEATPVPGDLLDLTQEEQTALLERLLVATLGTLLVISGMTMLGMIIWFFFLRPRHPARRVPHSTQGMPRITDTGRMPPPDTGMGGNLDSQFMPPMGEDTDVSPEGGPTSGSYRPVKPDEDTGPLHPTL